MTHQNEAQPAHATSQAGHTGVVVSQLLDEDWTPTADPSPNAFTEANVRLVLKGGQAAKNTLV